MSKKHYRIEEKIDGNGKSTFYPQYRSSGLFSYWKYYKEYLIEFPPSMSSARTYDSLEECKRFLNYKTVAKINYIYDYEENNSS